MMHHFAQLGFRQFLIVGIFTLPLMLYGASLEAAQTGAANSPNTLASSDDFLAPRDRAWIYDVGTQLYGDSDGDGYFSGISLNVDADTAFLSYRVFLVIDITPIGSNRGERLHTTRPFYIHSTSITDDYHIDIDLVQNFNPDLYDLSISLAEDGTNRLIDQITANGFRNLRSLPLESEDNDGVFVPVDQRPINTVDGNVRVEEHGGSSGYLFLAILLGSLALKIRQGLLAKRSKTSAVAFSAK